MAPSAKEIEDALVDGTVHVFSGDPDATSVNKVRKHVEEQLSLDEGYLTNEKWKSKSKNIIKEHVEKLLDGWTPENKPDTKKKAKKEDRNRTKKESPPKEDTVVVKVKESNKRKRKPDQDKGDDEKAASEPEQDATPAVDEEEEYSDVVDEPAPTKRKKKEAKSPTKATAKQTATKPAATASASSPEDPDEAEIKKLQSQLVKCGIRKLWHNELKQCGEDARAKIRHLRKMLSDAGMDGRFSEAKAREIRETRELLAEAEAAQEMNRLWGMDKGGRASRSKGQSMKEDSEESEAENGAESDDDVGNSFAARRRRAQADLAFLGSDSDSD